MKTVCITVEGGIVQHVEAPKGVSVVVRDYDVEECDSEFLQRDKDGDDFFEFIWTHEE
ncbi:MAG: hypothetical protein ACKVP0_06785 [Pirellulaceae bacterium]